MTIVCGGGTSSGRSGFGPTVSFSAGAIAALLNNIPTPWAVPLAGYIGLVTYNLATFCTTDPPAVPAFTAQDVVDLLNVYNPIVNVPAATKFQQLIGAYAWYQLCQCDTVTTPAPPAPPVPPPSSAPPPVGAPGLNCNEIGRLGVTVPPYSGDETSDFQRPAGDSEYTITFAVNSTTGGAIHWDIYQVDAAGAVLNNDEHQTGTSGPGLSFHYTHAWLAAARAVRIVVHASAAFSDWTGSFTVESCNPGGANTPFPVPPPTVTDATVLALLQSILTTVTLIQREQVPFAYNRGAVHAVLHDSGEFAVQGLIGCIVTLTTIPTFVGVEAGDPLEYFEAGWFNWGNADGFTRREHINVSPQVSFPAAAGQYTRIAYSLTPGVVATITELVREP